MRTCFYPEKSSNNYDLLNAFDFFKPVFERETSTMRTDIVETETDYELNIELAGYGKEDVTIDLKEGYLTIEAKKSQAEKEGEDKKRKYVLRERFSSVSRSYYVGEVKKESIKARFENGVLNVSIPKEQPEDKQFRIAIE